MRFLVDESTGRRFFNLLKNANFDVIYVGDILPSAEDEEILSFAENSKMVLITDDKDFGKLIFKLHKPSTGVILIRTKTKNPQKRFEIISNSLRTESPQGKFIVVKEESIRTRNI